MSPTPTIGRRSLHGLLLERPNQYLDWLESSYQLGLRKLGPNFFLPIDSGFTFVHKHLVDGREGLGT